MMSESSERVSKSLSNRSNWAKNLSVLSVGALALSVNFGVALVSVSTLFVVLTFVFVLFCGQPQEGNNRNSIISSLTIKVILLSLVWFGVTSLWSIADLRQVGAEFIRYARLLIIPLVFYLIRTPQHGHRIIQTWVVGHSLVIFTSYLLWLGIYVPWATSAWAIDFYTPFASSLEQPIMSSLIVAVVWFFRNDLSKTLGKGPVFVVVAFTLANVFFLMIGRSGMLSMILVLTMICGWTVRPRQRFLIVLLPFLLFGILYLSSTRFEERVRAIPHEVSEYQQGKIETSQALRLEFWRRSLQAIEARPLLGYGIGSWPNAYKLALNGDPGVKADSPHQQFLLWWVEGGLLGLILLLSVYAAIYFDALRLETKAKQALITILGVLFFTSLMNCPLQGAGMSEFFSVIIATLMSFTARYKS